MTPRTGDKVRFPDGRTTLALWISPDGSWFRAADGEAYFSSQVQVVPLSPVSGTEAAAA